jgi:hypothetical protein
MSNFSAKPKTSEIRPTFSALIDVNGEGLDQFAENAVMLSWTETHDRIVINGSSDVTLLSNIRGALLRLKEDLFSGE